MAERTFLQAFAAAIAPLAKAYQVPTGGVAGGVWTPIIREPFQGAWQRNLEQVNPALASTYWADFACKTLIARDIAKLPIRLMQKGDNDIWKPVENTAHSPVLRKPNHFQTRIQFVESWILSKLSRGNTYVLKGRDNRGVVTELYVLDPRRVTPLIAEDGSVFYDLAMNELAGLPGQVRVPATEIIHDRFNCDHWLVGVPPIYASGLAAMQGLNIQNQSIRLFANNAQPGGILTAPGNIDEADVERMKAQWSDGFTGQNFGKVAVLGSGLKYEKMSLTAVEGQLIEQLGMTAKMVCSTYHVPDFMIGAGPEPSTGSAQERTLRYYQQCLQSLIEDFEVCLDEGLGLTNKPDLGVEFNIDNLLRMDTASQAEAETKLVGGGIKTPNEGRRAFNLEPIEGGDTVYMQQQDIPMSVAAAQTEHPMAVKAQAAAAPPPADNEDDDDADTEVTDDDKSLAGWRIEKNLDVMLARACQ